MQTTPQSTLNPQTSPPGLTLERLYEWAAVGALLNGWLALLLASLGFFSLWRHLALLLLVGIIAGLYRFRSYRPSAIGYRLSGGNAWEMGGYALVGLVGVLLVLPPFEVILGVRDAAVYANTGFSIARTGSLVQHDPLLAQLGQAVQAADLAVSGPAAHALSNFLGVQNPERFIATRLYTAGFFIHEGDMPQGRIVPQHLHLFPAWIGLLTSVAGLRGGLLATGLLGLLGAWSVGMLGRRLAGAWVGWLACLLLLLNSVQVWFSRYPTSEVAAQFLTFAGLYFFAKFQQQQHEQEQGQPAAPLRYGGLAGVAFGQLALTRFEAVLMLAPLLLYLLYCLVARRWQRGHTAMAAGLGAMLLHAGLHIALIARAYFFDTAFARLQDYAITSYIALPFVTPLIREVYHTTNRSPFKDPLQLWREVAVLLLVLVVLVALWRWPGPLRWLEARLRHWHRWLAGAMALLVLVLASYAYLIRPTILTPTLMAALPGCLLAGQAEPPPLTSTEAVITATHELSATAAPTVSQDGGMLPQPSPPTPTPDAADPCLTLQGYIGAPIELPPPPPGLDEKYVIPLANMVRLGWYLSPLGIVLGVLGFALWWWRGLNRASWPFLVIGLLGTLFFVRDTYGTSDQTYIYILRRFVPVAYPAFSLGIAYALVALAARPRSPVTGLRFAFSGGLSLLLVTFFVWTGRPIYQHVEYQGAIEQVGELAARFEPDDVLLLRGGGPTYHQARDVPDLVATPLRFTFGRNALTVKSSQPGQYADALAKQVQRWQAEGRGVYLLLSASGGDFTLPGFALNRAGYFRLDVPEFEQLTDQKPHNVAHLRLPFTVYRLDKRADGQPAAQPGRITTPELPLTASDFAAQVRGFYLPEDNQQGTPYAWTDGDALLRIPWPLTSTLTLEAAGDERPAHLEPARLCLSVLSEAVPWPATPGECTPLECFTLSETMDTYRVNLPAGLPVAPTGSALLRLESEPWVPALADPNRHDMRPLGVQFAVLR